MCNLNPVEMFVAVAAIAGVCGAAFTYGVATVCRWMAWSPININVTVYRDEV